MVAPQIDARASTASSVVPIERLLVPTDFSPPTRDALGLAVRLAEPYAAKVILFYAPGIDDNDEFLDYTGVPWGRGDVIQEAYAQLSRFAEAVAPAKAGEMCLDAVRDDDPVAAVADACLRHRPSFVVLGTHARDRHRWFRSRAERIVRAIASPVIVVRGSVEATVDADE